MYVLPIFDGVLMDGHPIFWVVDAGVAGIEIFVAIHYDTIQDGQNKKFSSLIYLILILVRIV